MNAYANLFTLCNDCQKYISKHYPNNTYALNHIDEVIIGLNQVDFDEFRNNYSTSYSRNKIYFSKTTLNGLQLMASMLPDSSEILSDDKIDEIQAELQELLVMFGSSSINDQLRVVLVRNVMAMLDAINQYRLFGSEVFTSSLEQCTGALWLNQSLVNTDEEKRVCQTVLGFIGRTISFLNTNIGVIEYMDRFLE